MEILLIPSFNIVEGRLEPFTPYGILSLKASTHDLNCNVTIPLFSSEEYEKKFTASEDFIDWFVGTQDFKSFDVVGFSVVCNSSHYSLDIARRIKGINKNITVVFGGPYVTKLGISVLAAFDFVDAIFEGEGEVSFRKFAEKNIGKNKPYSFNGIPGVRTRSPLFKPSIVIDNLDHLPSIENIPDYFQWINRVREIVPDGSAVPLEATRGCPLKCSFCSTKQVWGPKVRRKSAEFLVGEMDRIGSKTNTTFFSLIGDNVGVPRNPFIKFCHELVECNNHFTWGCSMKLDKIKEQNLDTMWEAGCRAIFIGIESSSQTTLNKVNKAAKLEDEIRMTYAAIERGFNVETSFIIGFPWETEEDIKNTYNMHCELMNSGAFRSQVSLLSPIPGTEIVSGEDVVYDGLFSYFTEDGLELSDLHLRWIETYPELFSHFGRYSTPNVSKAFLKAYRDASSQMAALHAAKKEAIIEGGNHGRALGATYPYGREHVN